MYNYQSSKKFLAGLVSSALVASSAGFIAPNQVQASENFQVFKDVHPSIYYYEAVKSLTNRGIISGFTDSTYKPNDYVTRAQAAKILATSLGLDVKNIKNPGFSDVKTDNIFYGSIAALVEAGIVNGYGNTFRPEEPLTRAQMAKMITKGFGFNPTPLKNNPFKDVNSMNWYSSYLTPLIEKRITLGTTATTFSPDEKVLRGQMASFVFRSERQSEVIELNSVIESIQGEKVKIGSLEYDINKELLSWLNSSNTTALTGALIKGEVIGGELKSVSALSITAQGKLSLDNTYPFKNHIEFNGNNGKFNGTLTISGDFVSLKDINISGDLIIGDDVRNSLYTNNVSVEGKTEIIDDLGSAKLVSYKASNHLSAFEFNTGVHIIFENTNLELLEVSRNHSLIENKGTSIINEINISRNSTIESDNSRAISSITLRDGAEKVIIDANVNELNVDKIGEINISGSGNFDRITIEKDVRTNLDIIGTIATLNVILKESKIVLSEITKVQNLIVPKDSRAEEIVVNYESIKSNIEKVDGENNADNETPGSSNGGFVPNDTPTVISGQETQSGTATPASSDGITAMNTYSANASTWFADAESNPLTYSLVSATDASATDVSGDITVNASTGAIEYSPNAAQANQNVTIQVQANDGYSNSGVVNITVTVGSVPADNQAPTIVSGQETQSGTATPASSDGITAMNTYSANASTWFADAESNPLTYSLASATDASATDVSGDVTVDASTGAIEYSPNAAQANQNVTIQVQANDGHADSAMVTITVTIGSVPADAPNSTITSATYTESSDSITLTGTNFDTAGTIGSDIKDQLEWNKLIWDIDGDDTVTSDVTFNLTDITSATITNSTTLTIVLTSTKGASLEGSAGYDAGGVIVGTSDKLDVTGGFIKNDAGNSSTTDAVANASITIQP